MSTLFDIYDFYQSRFNVDEGYHSQLLPFQSERVCLVIPSHNEELDECLESLGRCRVNSNQVSVLIVFNNKLHSILSEKHHHQYNKWNNTSLSNGILVQAILAINLPDKHAGVGLARKIGMDAALALFAGAKHDGMIVCLDADCTVSENYLEELLRLEESKASGASLYFEHILSELAKEERERIVYYELWLRYYVNSLRSINYPFAFHTVGSSMAVRASVYAKIGGMNRRKAGEDFYFLHKLIPQDDFYDLTSATVFPSARESDRVPFGTGRAMLEMREGKKNFMQVYSPRIFTEIEPLITLGFKRGTKPYQHFDEPLKQAIEGLDWMQQIDSLINRSPDDNSLSNNFMHWMDGFRMLKLVHWLRDNYYGEVSANIAVGKLLNVSDINAISLLNTLRKRDHKPSKFD